MLDETRRWDRELSQDEQLCLVFARILIQAPPWVLIDGTFGSLEDDVLELVIDVFSNELQAHRRHPYRRARRGAPAVLERRCISSRLLGTADSADGDKHPEIPMTKTSLTSGTLRDWWTVKSSWLFCSWQDRRHRPGVGLEFHAPPSGERPEDARALFAIWPSGSCPSIRMPILIAISRICRRCKWSPATMRPRMSRGKRCAIGGGLVRIGQPVGRAVVYDIYAYAKAIEAENRVPFAEGFTRAFGEVVPRLGDHGCVRGHAMARDLPAGVSVGSAEGA